jgi:hypothetical protein
VKIAKADLVPTSANLLEDYRTFADLEAACRDFTEQINQRTHRETRRRPVEALAEEQTRLHPLAQQPFTVAFGTTRRVNWDCTISVDGARYSVPHYLVDTRVWARFHGDELIVAAVTGDGPTVVARHQRAQPGNSSIADEHYPPQTRRHDIDERPPRKPRSWLSVRAPRPGSPKPAPPASDGSAARGPKPSPWPNSTASPISTKRSGPPRWPAGSPTTTSSASSPINAKPTPSPPGQAKPTARSPAPPPGPHSASRLETSNDHHLAAPSHRLRR